MFRLLHTSDWHLGHSLHDVSRHEEHAAFLAWLLDTLAQREVDALIVAGDVFDSANPPAKAQAAYYRFLVAAQQRCPGLDIVVIGGNHDSAARLDAPRDLLAALGPRVVGGLPRLGADGGFAVAPERMVVDLRDRDGQIAARCLAMPFLRPGDLSASAPPATATATAAATAAGSAAVAGIRARYAAALAVARAGLQSTQALIVTGHCYTVGGVVSELSERRITCGGEDALPADVFGEAVDYVALGHLHRPQCVGVHDHVRYCGAPLALSLPEFSYTHEVRLLEFVRGRLVGQDGIPVPRAIDLQTVEITTLDGLESVFASLSARDPEAAPEDETCLPFLEVRVHLPHGEIVPRARIEAAVRDRACRLLKISVERPQRESAPAGHAALDASPDRSLGEIGPRQVFAARWQQRGAGAEMPEAVRNAFEQILQRAEAGDPDPDGVGAAGPGEEIVA